MKTFADFDVGVQIHPLDDELMKTRPDVVAVHDFVKDLVDSKGASFSSYRYSCTASAAIWDSV